MRNITTLLFDLGGVLVELGSLGDMMATSPFDEKEIWQNWIRSPSVRQFESGRCDESEFADSMINEFQLSVTADEFLRLFHAWPTGTFAGAESLLEGLSGRFRLACLSNTNLAHYERFLKHQTILGYFEATFFSHQTGILKPDQAAFSHAVNQLGVPVDQILFFDDNVSNVAAARALGLNAEQVNAPDEVRYKLNGLAHRTV